MNAIINAIESVEELSKLTAKEIARVFVQGTAAARIGYLRASHALIALVNVTGSQSKAIAVLKSEGVELNAVKNALRHVAVYDSVVRPGHANIDWFDAVLYMDAAAINRAVAKVGVKQLVEWELFDRPACNLRAEFELIADTGKNKAQRIVADEKKAAAAAKAAPEVDAAKAAAAEANATADATAETAATETTKGKPAVSPMAEFDAAAEKLEMLATGILAKCDDVVRERIVQRIAALGTAVTAAIAAKPSKKNHKVA